MTKNPIILKSEIQTVTAIVGKTKAKMFGNLKIGSKVQFSIPIRYAGSNRGSTHASYVDCTNLETGEETALSFNQLPTMLKNFVLTE
jgi:hypothetical protein